jgi:hypothetical protein
MAALASTAALFVRSRAFFRMLRRGHVPSRGIVRYATLRLMVSFSLTAVPIFAIQLVLGKPRLLLAIAFYLSL